MEYAEIDQVLNYYDVLMNAAESHGTLSGMLSIDSGMDIQNWLEEVFKDELGELAAEDRFKLAELYDETRRMLGEGLFEFSLLMPDDEIILHDRAAALRDWCRGYLYGVGYASDKREFSDECDEIIRDIAEISKLDPDVDQEEDEVAYAELIEYIRIGVQYILDEVNSGNQNRTLH